MRHKECNGRLVPPRPGARAATTAVVRLLLKPEQIQTSKIQNVTLSWCKQHEYTTHVHEATVHSVQAGNRGISPAASNPTFTKSSQTLSLTVPFERHEYVDCRYKRCSTLIPIHCYIHTRFALHLTYYLSD